MRRRPVCEPIVPGWASGNRNRQADDLQQSRQPQTGKYAAWPQEAVFPSRQPARTYGSSSRKANGNDVAGLSWSSPTERAVVPTTQPRIVVSSALCLRPILLGPALCPVTEHSRYTPRWMSWGSEITTGVVRSSRWAASPLATCFRSHNHAFGRRCLIVRNAVNSLRLQ